MDTFMDKLAQKLTAQEMIKANAAADAEELSRLKNQVGEYNECLDKMCQLNQQMEEALNQLVETGVARLEGARVDTSGINQLIEAGVSRLENAQVDGERLNQLIETGISRLEGTQADAGQMKRLVEDSLARIEAIQQDQEKLEKLQQDINEMFRQSEEHVHKENVKVYRNVQAVVVEESNKQTEAIGNAVKPFERRLTAVLGVSIAALVAALGSLALQILSFLNFKPF